MSEILIPLESIGKDFDEHLNIEGNSNLLFSWKFWLWKTYFLKDFFEKGKGKDEYETFHLFPVKYQISSNEDIIELLKYDLLVELINKDKKIFKDNKIEDFTDFASMMSLFYDFNRPEVLKCLVSFIPKVWKPLKETIWLAQKFWEFKTEVESWEQWNVDKFLKKVEENKIIENDNLSQLINEKITALKWKAKKSILILDDLDRIDPEHIFRIMNVFWAHFDVERENKINKFWFDKIMLVWDYDNLKSIFHHKYWEKTDFRWYIDKFYSSNIYFFDNSKVVNSVTKDIIAAMKCDDKDLALSLWTYWIISSLLNEILVQATLLNSHQKLNLRELLKWVKYSLQELKDNRQKQTFAKKKIYYLGISVIVLISIFWWKKDVFVSLLKEIMSNYSYSNSFSQGLYHRISNFFINDLYTFNSIDINKYNKSLFEEEHTEITLIKPITDKDLINTFYSLIIDYTEQRV